MSESVHCSLFHLRRSKNSSVWRSAVGRIAVLKSKKKINKMGVSPTLYIHPVSIVTGSIVLSVPKYLVLKNRALARGSKH